MQVVFLWQYFSSNDLETMISKDQNLGFLLGNDEDLTFYDIKTANLAYDCGGKYFSISSLPGGGGGGGHSLVSSVPMRDQKNDEKGYFFSRRAVRSADII